MAYPTTRQEDLAGSPGNLQRGQRRKKTNPSAAFSAMHAPFPMHDPAAMGYMGGMSGMNPYYTPPMYAYPFGMDQMMRSMYMPPMMGMNPTGYGGMHGGGPMTRPSSDRFAGPAGGKGGKGKHGKGADGKGAGRGKGAQRIKTTTDEVREMLQRAEKEDGPSPNTCPSLKALWTGEKEELSLDEIMPDVLEVAKDKKGCEELIRLLEEAGRSAKEPALAALTPEAKALSVDANGYQVVQKLFELANGEQRKALVSELKGDIFKLSTDVNGCRVVQKAIEHMSKEAQLVVAEELKDHISDCIHSMHANHVVQKCIEQMPPDTVQFIVEAVESEADALVVHRYGCRVVQRLLEHCAPHQVEQIMSKICEGTAKFAKDPFGNYVVQHMLQHGRKQDKKLIIAIIQAQILDFAQHKCSSNVVDKCFEVATIGEHAPSLDEERAALTRVVLGEEGDADPPIKSMMHDRFGSHIVQHMLEHSRGPEREELISRLKKEEPRLLKSAAGRRLANSLSGV